MRLEFGVGEHAGVSELSELLQLGQLVVGARGSGWFGVLHRLRGRWGLFGGLLSTSCWWVAVSVLFSLVVGALFGALSVRLAGALSRVGARSAEDPKVASTA